MNIHIADTESEIDRALPVLNQLRSSFTLAGLKAQIIRQMNDGFKLVYLTNGNTVVSVAGFVITEKLGWGKTLYIDDLVTDAGQRSKGAGKLMIDWLKAFAKENGCSQIHLDSRLSRLETHRFYEREGFTKASYHFSITQLGN
jgi:ribosomal protein S18 acetylase RimI-like enzyme